MTLKIYVAKDLSGKEWAPDYVQEVTSLEWMLKKAWNEFHHLPTMYCMIANMRQPSADLVVMTERGLGVLELKHSPGEITIGSDGSWYADGNRINAGIHLNPRTQVQKYAEQLRPDLLPWLLPASMKKDPSRWNDMKFQTGICFTNPGANFDTLSQAVALKRPPPLVSWESNFSVIGPSDFTAWVRELRFQVSQGPAKKFQPIRVPPTTIIYIATKVLATVEWKELVAAMPTGEPYGYLVLEDQEGRQVFNLHKDESVIGRSPNCEVVIPERYSRVSKRHCKIIRNVSGIEIIDLGSTNGTYLDGKIISDSAVSVPLSHKCQVNLGGQIAGVKVCCLTFEMHEQASLKPPSTEIEDGT